MKKYAIGIPTFQCDRDILKKTLISIINQRYFLTGDYSLIIFIVSDGEYEQHVVDVTNELEINSLEYIYCYYDYTKEKSTNLGAAVKQYILEKAHSVNCDYATFTDDDNLLLPDYLYEQTKAIEENDVDFSICKIIHFGPLFKDVAPQVPWILNGIPKLYSIDTIQVMTKTECLYDIGWEQVYGHCSDGITYERLAKKYKYVNVDKILGIHW
jgi:cellulose synthase/poly-beta-1,6-N-acetylglucosamine synthase-like glycosyltransferase